MRAMVMTGFGGPEVLKLREIPAPTISGPDDVLIRVHAAGVNPADWKTRSYPVEGYNFGEVGSEMILGLEAAGVVEAVGSAVTRLKPWDRVYFVDGGFGSHSGNYKEYKVLHQDCVARMPAHLDFPMAAAIPTVFLTAWEPLVERQGVKAGDFVLVHGGAGGVGHMAVQIARLQGARVAVTVSSEKKAQLAASMGAERIIRYRDEDVGAAVRSWSGKDGADVVFDAVGGDTFAKSIDLTAPYGTLINCAGFEWPRTNPANAVMRGIKIVFENMGLPQILANIGLRKRQREVLEIASNLFDEGKLRLIYDRSYALELAGAAQEALEHNQIVGRLSLDFSL